MVCAHCPTRPQKTLSPPDGRGRPVEFRGQRLFGPLAQLGERLLRKQDVAGSNPARSTNTGVYRVHGTRQVASYPSREAGLQTCHYLI